MTGDDAAKAARVEASEFAREIMTQVYGYRSCESFSTFQDGESEPDGWCLTHDQSVRYCREYQAEILAPLTALIEARDALADPADRDDEAAELRSTVERCERLADEWKRIDSTPAQWAAARLSAALDPEGGVR